MQVRQENPYEGITFITHSGKFEATLGDRQRWSTVGRFDTLEEAVAERLKAKAEHNAHRREGRNQ